MRKIINECYETAKKILSENKDLVKLIADNLLEYETLTKEQIEYLVQNGKMPEEEDFSKESVEELKQKAKDKGIKGYSKMSKDELVENLKDEEEAE